MCITLKPPLLSLAQRMKKMSKDGTFSMKKWSRIDRKKERLFKLDFTGYQCYNKQQLIFI